MVAFGNGIVIDFGPLGLWYTAEGVGWSMISSASPEYMSVYGTSLLVGDFGGLGVWQYNGTMWSPISSADPDNVGNAMTDLNLSN
jgi:hypothetical protein